MSLPVHGPHAHSSGRMPQLMLQVMLALLPATLYGFWLYGWPAVNLWIIALASALFWEAILLRLFRKPLLPHLADGSALVTGWLLVLCLPPWAPAWLVIIGNLLALSLCKHVFGGLGQNLFNPAMTARVMLLIAFPVEMTQWIGPDLIQASRPEFADSLLHTLGSASLLDGYSGATLLDGVQQQLSRGHDLQTALAAQDYQFGSTLTGFQSGSFGESTALLLLAGGLFLLWRGVVTWQAPVGLLLGLGLPALVFNLWQPATYAGISFHLLTGGAMLAAWFIVTDPVTCPSTGPGRLVFGIGCGLLTWLIRTFGNYPEGIAFAVMLMNSASPLIDRYIKPRIYGRTLTGQPRTPRKISSGETP